MDHHRKNPTTKARQSGSPAKYGSTPSPKGTAAHLLASLSYASVQERAPCGTATQLPRPSTSPRVKDGLNPLASRSSPSEPAR